MASPAVATDNTSLNGILAQMPGDPTSALLQQRMKVTNDAVGQMKQAQGQEQKITDQIGAVAKPAAPNLVNPSATPPVYHQLEPIQAFQNWGVALAMIGSLFTRQHLTAAFNTGAAAMKSFHANDLQNFEIQRQTWKDNLDAAMQQNKVELDKYEASLKSSEFDLNKLSAEWQRIAAGSKDSVMMATLQSGNLDEAINLYERRRDIALKLKALGLQQDMKGEAMSIHRQTLDERIRHDKAMEGLSGSKVSSANDLTGLIAQGDAINGIISSHQGVLDSLTGAVGMAKRGMQRLGGQLGVNLFPEATDLEGKISAFQTQLTRPFLKAHYFTEPTIARIEELASGMNFKDDPATTIQNYKTIIGILQEQQKQLQSGALQGGDTGGSPDLSGLTNDQILQELMQ
jgi:hypothetical protein